MTLSPPLADALARMDAALHRLQAAAEQRVEADDDRAARDREFALLQEDRARLAAALDAALAQQGRLATAQAEVSRRLDRAGRSVGDVLETLKVAGGAR